MVSGLWEAFDLAAVWKNAAAPAIGWLGDRGAAGSGEEPGGVVPQSSFPKGKSWLKHER